MYVFDEKAASMRSRKKKRALSSSEKRRLLLLHDHLLPQPGVLLQARLRPRETVLVDEQRSHAAEHETGHHAHGCGTDAEALAGLHPVVVLHGIKTHLLQPLAPLGFELWQHHVALHQGQQYAGSNDGSQLVPEPLRPHQPGVERADD